MRKQLNDDEILWLKNNEHKLPKMSRGSKIGKQKIRYAGSINDLTKIIDMVQSQPAE